MKEYTYRIQLQPLPKGGYTVTVPDVPGCVTYGVDTEHAVSITKDALALYLEGLDRLDSIPKGSHSREYSINLVHEYLN